MADWEDEIEAMRRRFDRLVERRSVDAVRRAYEAAQDRALRQVHSRAGAKRSELITQQTYSSVAKVVLEEQVKAARTLLGEVLSAQEEAHLDSMRGLDRFVARMEGRTEILRDRGELIRQRQRLGDLRSATREDLKNQATQIAVSARRTLRDALREKQTIKSALHSLEDVVDHEFWRLERMTRTRVAGAYNAAQLDGIEALAEEDRKIYARWVEHVDDRSWVPLDNRVGKDSIELHGQVQIPGGAFHMPSSGPRGFEGMAWTHPPNRPNDRAIVMPWQREWRIPAYVLRSGKKYWLVPRSRA